MAALEQDSLADLGRQIADDAARMVRLEIDLAKAEMQAKLRLAMIGLVFALVAATFAFIALIFALATIPVGGFMHVVPEWVGWLITAFIFIVIAALFGWRASRRLQTLRETPETVTSIRENVEWAKRLTRRSGSSS